MADAGTSKTLGGLVIAVIGPFVARYGIEEADLELIVQGFAAAVGGVIAVWGRQTATGPITHVLSVPVPQAFIPAVKLTEWSRTEPVPTDPAATLTEAPKQ